MDDHLTGHWYRGGTSKCWLFPADAIPGGPAEISRTLIRAFGSGDPGQLDGVGGATSTTSKAAIVAPSRVPGADVGYVFAQVGIAAESVEFSSNCGNCAAAVALFAVHRGLVVPAGEVTTVRMYNENTRAIVSARVDTPGGLPPHDGEERIPGSPRPGVGVDVNFENPDGTTTGSLLPTGRAAEAFDTVRATCLDAGAPACLVDAATMGLGGSESLAEMESALPALFGIRAAASIRMGLTPEGEPPSPAVPKVGIVGPPRDYTTTNGEPISAGEYDLAVRMVSMWGPHPSISITSAVAIARAASVSGSVAHAALGRPDPAGVRTLRIGTPAGIVRTSVAATAPLTVGIRRIARQIATADISLPAR